MVDEVFHLGNQVGGEKNGAVSLGKLLHQQPVEQIPVLSIQAQNRLIKDEVGGVDAEAQDQPEDGGIPGGQV